jgi:hypothetical protein
MKDRSQQRPKVFASLKIDLLLHDFLVPNDQQGNTRVLVEYYLDRRDADPYLTSTFNIYLNNVTRVQFIDAALSALNVPFVCCDNKYRETAVFKIRRDGRSKGASSFSTIMTDRQWSFITSKLKHESTIVVSFVNNSWTASDLTIYSKPYSSGSYK